MSKLSVLLVADSPLVRELLNKVSLHQLALDEASSFSKANNGQLIEVAANSLLETIKNLDSEIVVIHDALRPLVSAKQMQRTFDALDQFDAVRPTMAFTETIKSLDADNYLNQTIDREKVRRISSPEVIRKSAIDFEGAKSGKNTGSWSVPLIVGAKVNEVAADPESIRINSAADLRYLSALLTSKTLSK